MVNRFLDSSHTFFEYQTGANLFGEPTTGDYISVATSGVGGPGGDVRWRHQRWHRGEDGSFGGLIELASYSLSRCLISAFTTRISFSKFLWMLECVGLSESVAISFRRRALESRRAARCCSARFAFENKYHYVKDCDADCKLGNES
jgi:hypothetical protein